jgi:BirA family biotin operon repressor/biotin-[acetyl-CoA-carboxylase] ligase
VKSYIYGTIESTNLQARRLWEAQTSNDPFAVVADEQTGGVGRQGRRWQSPRGGLWMTVAWPAFRLVHEYQGLPLAAGHALASLLESDYHLTPQIKWPNDVLIAGRKIAGILCQSQALPLRTSLLVGIGVNVNFMSSALGTDMRCPPTSLQEELGHTVNLAELRVHLLSRIESVFNDYEANGLDNIIGALRQRLAWVGDTVRGEGAGQPVTGVVKGLDTNGGLLLRCKGSTRTFVSGELERISMVEAQNHNE